MIYQKRNIKINSNINITPFVDIVLVLLIIFMITTSIVYQNIIIDIANTTKVINNDIDLDIEIFISKEGFIYIKNKLIQNHKLEKTMRKLFTASSNKSNIVINADEMCEYDCIMQFINKAKKAGAKNVILRT
ncbi:MAG: biopolymer transporter ExbD [Endomicrobium sp.]|jgi:biopolymer transport protein TolR|nr:biopolymer transporter ExbD [Endomicrobium sp.]